MELASLVELVERSMDSDSKAVFERRVADQARFLHREIESGTFEANDYAIGLEVELYGIDDGGTVTTIPDQIFEKTPATKELGRHNLELQTTPTRLSTAGIEAQANNLERVLSTVTEADSTRPILDAMWTIPPAEGALEYLGATTTTDPVTISKNMRPSPRYCALDNEVITRANGTIGLSVPGVSVTFPSLLFESLATSIQPHLQIPDPSTFPTFFNYAIRTMGPVLALGTNSPFLPPEFYGDADPMECLANGYHELRIPVFESAINVNGVRKVKVPRDIDTVSTVVDRLEADTTYAPFLREWITAEDTIRDYTDNFWELDHKRGTYWRWVRAVIGGDPVGPDGKEETIRIEYRPIPTQPTITETVGFQCLVSGLLVGLVEADHPISNQPWSTAEDNFYAAVSEGLGANFEWILADGTKTSDTATIYEELFSITRDGLTSVGIPPDSVAEYLSPLEARIDEHMTPSIWKRAVVRHELQAGATFESAMTTMQQRYFEFANGEDPVVSWPRPA